MTGPVAPLRVSVTAHRRLSRLMVAATIAACPWPSPPLGAQRGPTVDSPRMLIGLYAGTTQGGALWQVSDQPVPTGNTFDHLTLERRLTSGPVLGAHLTSFVRPTFGISGEVSTTRLRTLDHCEIAVAGAGTTTTQACTAINRTTNSSSATHLLAGAIYRPMVGARVQMYLLAKAGVAVLTDRLADLQANVGTGNGSLLYTVYRPASASRVAIARQVGAGISALLGNGMQARVELRESWLPLSRVTGPTPTVPMDPPVARPAYARAQLLIGLDLVLAKRYGRRY